METGNFKTFQLFQLKFTIFAVACADLNFDQLKYHFFFGEEIKTFTFK